MAKKALFTSLLFIATLIVNSQTLTIKICGIEGNSGKIILAFFTSSDNFSREKSSYSKTINMSEVKNGNVIVSYDNIKPDTYGIGLLHDENNDGKMSYSFYVPTEGFGFSNYYHKGIKKPKFGDFSFKFGSQNKTIVIKVKYL